MKVLVTGGSGFIGTNMIERLVGEGHEVLSIDIVPPSGSTWVGLMTGAAGGVAIAGVQAEMSHRLAADQFVVGLTLNILILGLAGFLDREIDTVTQKAKVIDIPLLNQLPLVGNALFGQWVEDSGNDMVPAGRDAGRSYAIKRFGSLQESVAAYMRNLNSHRAYRRQRSSRGFPGALAGLRSRGAATRICDH